MKYEVWGKAGYGMYADDWIFVAEAKTKREAQAIIRKRKREIKAQEALGVYTKMSDITEYVISES
jgi:hypothetical protein